jgi:hypothetical protein
MRFSLIASVATADFTSFALSFGSLLVLVALIAAWLLRTTSAPLWIKVALPSLAVALGCYAPFAVSGMMGYPVSVAFEELPDRAELIAFVPYDADKRVDLWLKVADAPRAYETQLDANLKKTLREAGDAMAHGRPAMLMKRSSTGAGGERASGQDRLGIGDDSEMYVLDPTAMSALPPKE